MKVQSIFEGKMEKIKKDEEIELKKRFGEIYKESKKSTNKKICLYCNNKVDSFCNSHSIPSFCLKKISQNGKLLTINLLINVPTNKNNKGVKETATFHIICRDCDNKVFREYENPENYSDIPSQKMLKQIAIKNYMYLISKRIQEKALYKSTSEYYSSMSDWASYKSEISDMDLFWYIKSYETCKRYLECDKKQFYMFYYEKLDYVSPMVFQGTLSLVCDLEGNIINNIYSDDSSYEIKDFHLCVFPFEQETIIFMFVDQLSAQKRYRRFIKQFNKKTNFEKLQILNYLIISYSEDVFFSPEIPPKYFENTELIKIGKLSTDVLLSDIDNMQSSPLSYVSKMYTPKDIDKIPNFLSKELALSIG